MFEALWLLFGCAMFETIPIWWKIWEDTEIR